MSAAGPTLGLAIISPDWETAKRVVEKYQKYFDHVYLEINKVFEMPERYDGVTFIAYKWNDNFADARNALHKEIETDYYMWIDTDDEIVNPGKIRELVTNMYEQDIDVAYMEYLYAQNDYGETAVTHKRERIIRTTFPFTWMGPVHETLVTQDRPKVLFVPDVAVEHLKHDEKDILAARKRNHKILVREYKKQPRDPRITFYCGMSFYGLGKLKEAIPYFEEHIKTAGSPDDIYRSHIQLYMCFSTLGNLDAAYDEIVEAQELMPERPEAYVHKADFLVNQENFKAAIEWLDVSNAKPDPQGSFQVFDPTIRYQAAFLKALCLMHLGKVKQAYSLFSQVCKASPDYKPALELKDIFEEAFGETLTIEKVAWLAEYLSLTPGSHPQKLLDALPQAILSDARLNPVRAKLVKPRIWPEKSLAYICGSTPDLWGPEYMERGMGGSEEAAINLSRELVKLGWEVKIYQERDEAIEADGVEYLPISLFNPSDSFDVICSWRMQDLFVGNGIKARLKIVDLHDTPLGHAVITPRIAESVDLFMFKTQYQRDLAPDVDDSKAIIAPNGIVPEHFSHEVKRNPLKVVYGSSPDRGLSFLLDIWPEVKAEVPKAELHIYYGWNTFDGFHRNNPAQMKWKLDIIRKVFRVGAIDHGRISHEELAKEYLSAGVWAYPTEFPEISCITAMKVGAAGMMSVTSGTAALGETVLKEYGLPGEYATADIYENEEARTQYVHNLVRVLKYAEKETNRTIQSKAYIRKYAWENVAKLWDDALS